MDPAIILWASKSLITNIDARIFDTPTRTFIPAQHIMTEILAQLQQCENATRARKESGGRGRRKSNTLLSSSFELVLDAGAPAPAPAKYISLSLQL